jgi:hypothetical protein
MDALSMVQGSGTKGGTIWPATNSLSSFTPTMVTPLTGMRLVSA